MAELFLLLVLVVPLLVLSATVYGTMTLFRREWQGTWKGHRVLVQNWLNEENLFIDGKLIARAGNGWMKFESTLTGEFEGEAVMAIIKPSRLLTAVSAELFIGGVAIPLEEAAAGTFENTLKEGASTNREPADPRWHALGRLVSQIRSAAPEQSELAAAAADHVRALLSQLEELAEAKQAHDVLDTSGVGSSGVGVLLEAREESVRQLIHAVQALHLSAMAGSAEPAALRELMARLEVEVETDVGRARRAQAAKARQLG